MKANRSSLFWGILLVAGGGLALVQQMGYLNQFPDSIWMWIFGFVSLVAILSYALSGWKDWGWLFPAGVFGGLAVIIGFAVSGYENAAVGSPLFFGLLIPFAAAYLTDRSKNWWALIPGGVMLFLALVTLLVDTTANDEWIGALFLFMVGLPFLIVYLRDRTKNWWALIPAGILLFLSLIVMLSTSVQGEWIGALFLLAVAIPFYVVYFRSGEQNWWAIIPAGVMITLAVIATLGIAGWIRDADVIGITILMGGLAATFAVLWLRHVKSWARDVTIVLAVLTVVAVFFGSDPGTFWPVAFIFGGAYLLYTAMRPKNA